MNKFLIVNPFGIGDVLFTTPVIDNIRDKFEDSFIGYWCNERVSPLLKNDRRINKVFALSRGDLKKIYARSVLKGINRSWGLYFGLKRERFDVSLDYSLDHRYGLVTKLAGIKKRIGFNYKDRGRFLTDKSGLEGYSNRHVVEYYLDLLKPIDIEPKRFTLRLNLGEKSKALAKKMLSSYNIDDNNLLVAIAPGGGASWGQSATLKHWPAQDYAELADEIITTYGAKILLLGDASERHIADTILGKMKQEPIDLTAKTTLEELAAIINRVELLIANDGGPLHLAVALQRKSVSIFGPVDERVYGPYPPSNRHIVIAENVSCRPCYQKFRMPICDKNRLCITSISVAEVSAAVKRLL